MNGAIGEIEYTERMARRILILIATAVLAGCSSPHGLASKSSTTQPSTTQPSTTHPSTTMGTATTGNQLPCGGATDQNYRYQHVIWIWMENKSADAVVGAKDAPFENDLMSKCATASQYVDRGVHPSLPNYLAATSGNTQDVADDGDPSAHRISADNIFRQVRESGRTERSYEEDMPGNCSLIPSGRYAVKHNPAAYYIDAQDREACHNDDVALPVFTSDLAAGQLPSFSFVTPNLCNDMHDCSVKTGDDWLNQFLTPVLSSASYRNGGTAIFVVWDEDSPMPFIAIAPSIPPGTVLRSIVDHYSLLRTTEQLLGLPPLASAQSASSLSSQLHIQ